MSLAALPSSTPDDNALESIPAFSCRHGNSGEGIAYVRPAGELDLATVPQLEQTLRLALRGARLVVLDLSELEFIDTSGVHAIAAATSAARTMGRRLITLRGPDHIHHIFALTDSENDIDIHIHEAADLSLSATPRLVLDD